MTTIHSIENLLKNNSTIENNSCSGSASSDSEQSEMNCPHEMYQNEIPTPGASNNATPDEKQNITQEWFLYTQKLQYRDFAPMKNNFLIHLENIKTIKRIRSRMKILNHDENKDDFEQHSVHTSLKSSNSLLPKLTIPMFLQGKHFSDC